MLNVTHSESNYFEVLAATLTKYSIFFNFLLPLLDLQMK